jgi:hypothetical protein
MAYWEEDQRCSTLAMCHADRQIGSGGYVASTGGGVGISAVMRRQSS